MSKGPNPYSDTYGLYWGAFTSYNYNIINTSLQEDVFPNALKEGLLLSKFKNINALSDKEAKLLEWVAASQTKRHLIEHRLLPGLQATYQSFHSTETALLRVHIDILRSIEDGKKAILVVLDLHVSAAFNTIDHSIPIDRLRTQIGVTGTVLEWFKSYILGRSQKVVIGYTESKPQLLTSGILQGSVLGPLLFIPYFAPLGAVIESYGLNCMMHAEDSQEVYNRKSRR